MLARLMEFLKEHIGKTLLATGLGSAFDRSRVADDFGAGARAREL